MWGVVLILACIFSTATIIALWQTTEHTCVITKSVKVTPDQWSVTFYRCAERVCTYGLVTQTRKEPPPIGDATPCTVMLSGRVLFGPSDSPNHLWSIDLLVVASILVLLFAGAKNRMRVEQDPQN